MCTPPAGIVSWWHADGDFDDAIGDNDGVSGGSVAFVPAHSGTGFGLNGSATSYVEVPDDDSLDLTGAFTIDAWIASPGSEGRIVDKITPFGSDGYLVDMLGGFLRIYVAGDSVLSAEALPRGPLTHIAAVYTGTALQVYVNGVLSAEKPTSVTAIPVNTRPLRIGADSGGGSLFNGTIDEPRIFSRALGQAEILTLFQTTCP
jgi:hypothetical protein